MSIDITVNKNYSAEATLALSSSPDLSGAIAGVLRRQATAVGKVWLAVMFVLGYLAVCMQAGSVHWQDADLTRLTVGPKTSSGSGIAMAFDPIWNTPRTHYIGADQHVHELYISGGSWHNADLTALTGGPNAYGSGVTMTFDNRWRGIRTHYIAADRHVHELFLYGTRWQDADLTALTGGPTAYGIGIASTFDPLWNTPRTHYVAADQHVHELFLWGDRWQDADLTKLTGGPSVAYGSGIAIVFDPTLQGIRTHYLANFTNQPVHELYLSGSQWHDANLSALSGGPTGYGNGIAMAFDSTYNLVRTHYTAIDHHVHELIINSGRWQDADLNALAGGNAFGSGVAMAFDPVAKSPRTHYISANQHVHELDLYLGRWQDSDLTAATGGPATWWNGLAMIFDPAWNRTRTHYIGSDQHVHELTLVGP